MRSLILLVLLLTSISLFAQEPKRSDGRGMVSDLLNVRFSDGAEISLEKGKLLLFGEPVLAEYGYWTRLYSISEAEMTRLKNNAEKNLGKKLPDPNYVFLFHLNDAANRDKAQDLLRRMNFVTYASKVPIPVNATAPDYESSQLFIHDGPAGIHADGVWASQQNRGAGIKICDVEYLFNQNHVDLPSVTVVGGVSTDPFSGAGTDHGTAVLGEMGALNNGTGVTGIASESQLYFSGVYVNEEYQFENAMMEAALALSPGDLILIEQHVWGPNSTGNGQEGYVPMEWYISYYDAIVLAIGQGAIVIEAAGNGGEDLDAPIYSQDNDGHYPFLEGNGSGAIMIGAGAVGQQDDPRAKMWFSNYGTPVHVQGNGEGVTTTGYGDLFNIEGVDAFFTANFSGTSSASPIVTGAVALLQSVYLEETGQRLTRDQVLYILQLTGKPQVGSTLEPLDRHIGPLPDISAAIDYLVAHLDTKEWQLQAGFTVYPNPGNGSFQVAGIQQAKDLAIYDLSGKTVSFEVQPVMNELLSITLPDAVEGVYFLQSEGRTEKIVVTK